ncbi:MAG: hypothetical protein JWQ70_2988 [Aeromicrobium sp.]|jgi:ABC-type phosphate/phosphonate transport system substrate-binding protein|nr:hypothetical protein [Aeromicrobium sp.]
MRRIGAALVFVLALAGCGGSSSDSDGHSPTSTASATATAPGGEVDSTQGLPKDFAFPPGAQVEPVTPHITQYLVKATTADKVKSYWESYFPSIGFKKYNEASASVFYSKGSVKAQATYAQFGADVQGTIKVLTP